MKASPFVTSQTFCTTDCGLITSLEVGYLRQSRLRHSSICFHQAVSALGSGRVSTALNCDNISTSTSLTLPTIGMSTLTRLEIDDRSIHRNAASPCWPHTYHAYQAYRRISYH